MFQKDECCYGDPQGGSAGGKRGRGGASAFSKGKLLKKLNKLKRKKIVYAFSIFLILEFLTISES